MKKPEKTLPLCPRIKEPCVEAGCRFWLEMERIEAGTGKREKYSECADIVRVGVIAENSRLLIQVMDTLQKMRNEGEMVHQSLELNREQIRVGLSAIGHAMAETLNKVSLS